MNIIGSNFFARKSIAMGTNPRNIIQRVQANDRHLMIDWGDAHQSVFHYVWLRFNCACEQCGDLDSGVGTLLITEIPEDISAGKVRLDDLGRLQVEWDNDSHWSCFDPLWLRAHCYSDSERERRRHRPSLWDASLTSQLSGFDYSLVMRDESQCLKLLEEVRDRGFARILAAPTTPAGLENVAGMFGQLMSTDLLGRMSEIATSPDKRLVTDTALPIPKHTDVCYRHAPSGIQFFQGVKTSLGGGETILGDGFKIAAVLRDTQPEAFKLLSTVPLQFYRYLENKVAYYSEGLAISVNHLGEVVGFRYANRVTAAPLDLPEALMGPMHDALRKLVTLMNDPALEVRFLLEPGHIVVFDNQRVLHGRTAYDDSMGERHLRRCEVTREEFHSRLRLLMIKLGRPEPRNLVLSHGALA